MDLYAKETKTITINAKPMKLVIKELDDGGAWMEIDKVCFHFTKHVLAKMQLVAEPGKVDFVLKTDLIDDKAVEVMVIDGRVFTKTEIRAFVREQRLVK